MSNGTGGGGGLIIGDQPVEYWVRSFLVRLPDEEQDKALGILSKYDAGQSLKPSETQYIIHCLAQIAASLDGH